MKVSYSHLLEQFKDPDPILTDIKKLVKIGDFTLGKPLEKFEKLFAKFIGRKYAVGVGTGTDALRLSLVALNIRPGDEVITAVNTFYSTAAAIATIGAKPVFIDVRDDYVMDTDLIENVISENTKALIPVHLNGCPVDMEKVMKIAEKYNLFVIEDTCQAIGAEIYRKKAGSFGITGCFSLHPLKNINVWGDGGIVLTDSEEIMDKFLLLRNNGLKNRDECDVYAYNCRLDTLQAVVGLHVIKDIDNITRKRIENGKIYDEKLSEIKGITIPPRNNNIKNVHHNYVVMAEKRNDLLKLLIEKDIEAKIHYPIPLHLQKASKYLGYKEGDFPVAEHQAKHIISLPVHQHLTNEQIQYVVDSISEFYI
jgi:dTDP-4-amino-4,6-dideoxygalactose transaminase